MTIFTTYKKREKRGVKTALFPNHSQLKQIIMKNTSKVQKICKVIGCKKHSRALDYCSAHYQRFKKRTSLNDPIKIREIHGMCGSREYGSWQSMKDRCYNKKNPQYKDYGGRGITVCDEWKNSFSAFYSDLGDRPSGTSIDRIKNDKGYYKGNCRWATSIEQTRNKRTPKNNTSGFVGISWFKESEKWLAKITTNKKQMHIGLFTKLEDAVEARRLAELKQWKQ